MKVYILIVPGGDGDKPLIRGFLKREDINPFLRRWAMKGWSEAMDRAKEKDPDIIIDIQPNEPNNIRHHVVEIDLDTLPFE